MTETIQEAKFDRFEFLYGMFAGLTGTILSHPLDTIRIRL